MTEPIIMDSSFDIDNATARIKAEVKSAVEYANKQSDSNVVEAEQTLRNALELSEINLGHDNYTTMRTVAALGDFYCRRGNLIAAEAMYQRLLDDGERVHGRLDERTLFSAMTLGHIYLAMPDERLEDCESMYTRAVQGYQKLDPEGERALSSKTNLALALECRGKHHQAEHLYLQVLSRYKRTIGLTNPTAIGAIGALRAVFHQQAYNLRQGPQKKRDVDSNQRNQIGSHLIRILTTIQELELPVSQLLETIAKICFWDDDHDNCRKIFQWYHQLHPAQNLMDNPTTICSLCDKTISDLPRYFCMSCDDVDICGKCFGPYQNRQGPRARILPGCAAHSFFEIEHDEASGVTLDPDRLKVEVDVWLRELLQSKRTVVPGAHLAGDWDDGSVRINDRQGFRVFEVRQRIPAMLRYAFTLDGMFHICPHVNFIYTLTLTISLLNFGQALNQTVYQHGQWRASQAKRR